MLFWGFYSSILITPGFERATKNAYCLANSKVYFPQKTLGLGFVCQQIRSFLRHFLVQELFVPRDNEFTKLVLHNSHIAYIKYMVDVHF